MSVLNHQYNIQTLDQIKKCVRGKKAEIKKGCINQPLIEIEPQNSIPDELHLFLRITDVIFYTLFGHLIALDNKSRVHRTESSGHLQAGVQFVRRLGISFNVWMCEDKQSKSRSAFEMTALNRNERLKILKNFPVLFDKILPQNVAVPLAKLWVVC